MVLSVAKLNPTRPSWWTSYHMNYGSKVKTMGLIKPYLRSENSDFDHLDKIVPSLMVLKDESKTNCGPLWYGV